MLLIDLDHSERAFYKELVKVIEASDVILEVLDARDPLGSRCLDMEKMVLKAGPEKHLVLLLNKIGPFLQYSYFGEYFGFKNRFSCVLFWVEAAESFKSFKHNLVSP